MSLTELLSSPPAARQALDRREVGVVELTRAALERAAELQPVIGAFAEITYELAREQAERAEESLRAGGARSALHGLPVAVKDVIDVAGVSTRLGTPRAGHRVPSASAAAVDALLAAGAVVIGKTTTHELAYGMITPPARNPRATSRITGGSSGGSAAAVAASIVAAALGTDTNGSVRCPAAHCGVVGLKPTREAVSRAGVAPLAWSQDTVGVLAPTVEGVAHAWAALSRTDLRGTTHEPRRVGLDRGACDASDPDVAGAVTAALDALAADGIEVVEVTPPDHRLSGSASLLALVAEAAEAWARELDAAPEGFGPRVRAALRAGREVPRDAYLDAKRVRALVRARMRELFEDHSLDALALPTVPVTAAPVGTERVTFGGRERAVESLQSAFTALGSLTGQPAVSVPCGRDAGGLPIGLQLLGRAGGEEPLLALAARVEAHLPTVGSFV